MMEFKQSRREFKVVLRKLADGHEAWGTEQGAKVFSKVSAHLLPLPEGTLVAIDYAGVERTDISFQREAVVETIRKHRPRLLFIAVGLENADVEANIDSALERRGESLLVRFAGGKRRVLGKQLTKEHATTLDTIRGPDEFTSGMLTEKPFGLESSTASARLTTLWKAGLVERVQGAAPSGGREYKYYSIE